MHIGIIGLGRMGLNIAEHLLEQNHVVVAYNRSQEAVKRAAQAGAIPAYTIGELCLKLSAPRVIFIMVPAGQAVDDVLGQLKPELARGDIIIDGGNSNYLDSVRRGKALAKAGIHFLDCGTSGGLSGARHGACLTIGGEEAAYRKLIPLWKAIACEGGYLYCGKSGAGHYVKMVHNGIEYSLLQAYGEGFELLHKAPYRLDLASISDVWTHGSVIRSWLLELGAEKLKEDAKLAKVAGKIGGGETGGWTLQEARRRHVKMPALTAALSARRASATHDSVSGRLIAYIRNGFGAHEMQMKKGRKTGKKE
ncbi:6-phosphogluconate dehydrogenase, NAD(+)-dependent, decarboxylating [uncultured archaeon]|nr:6-phosphogluconate dehydrogenase, NAD(+)-dependent, decarboxylating [uncultured archaeon]